MKRYFLGVDVGATKTHALVADDTGLAVSFGESGPGNHETVGYDGLVQALQGAVHDALAMAGIEVGQIAGAGFGIAGYDWPAEREPTLEAIRPLGIEAPIELVNDTLVGLLAGASDGWGVAVVAGTGCNCWGWDRLRRVGRVTGHGAWMGEGAGASELVGNALCAVSRAWSQRSPATRLTAAFVEQCGARDADDLLEGLCLGRYHLEADAAPLVFRVAAEGDQMAREVIDWAGRELGSLAVGVIRQLEFEPLDVEVVLVGGLYDGGPMLVEPMRQVIHQTAPRARMVRLSAPPVIGGVLLGAERAGRWRSGLRERLIESTKLLRTPPP